MSLYEAAKAQEPNLLLLYEWEEEMKAPAVLPYRNKKDLDMLYGHYLVKLNRNITKY